MSDLPPTDAHAALVESSRLAAVRATGLLGSAAAASWDQLTGLAARLLDAPMAFMTVADDRQSYWLSCSGLDLPGPTDREHPVGDSFCQYVIADRAPFVVGDATTHPRTRDNASVALLGARAWAGFPVVDAQGLPSARSASWTPCRAPGRTSRSACSACSPPPPRRRCSCSRHWRPSAAPTTVCSASRGWRWSWCPRRPWRT